MKALVVLVLVAAVLVETQGTFYPGCWTEWFDRDDPTATGDWETLSDQRKLTPGKICDRPLQIEVQTVTGDPVSSTGDIISISDPLKGFVCENKNQTHGRMCSDYRVRYECPVEFCQPKGCWTKWFDRDDPSATGDWETLELLSTENPGEICDSPLYLEVLTTSGASVESTGDNIDIASPSSGFVCQKNKQKDNSCEDYKVRFYCPEEFCLSRGCWTQWFDRDNPSGKGDWETLEELQHEYPGKLCDFPLRIEVETTDGNSADSTGDVFTASDIYTGFICENSQQTFPPCKDYRVRFFCPEEFCSSRGCWTEWFDRDNPGGMGDFEDLETLLNENPGQICEFPLQIEVQTTSGNSVSSTGDVITASDTTTGFVCQNSQQLDGRCEDYRVRFYCPEEFCNSMTGPFDLTSVSTSVSHSVSPSSSIWGPWGPCGYPCSYPWGYPCGQYSWWFCRYCRRCCGQYAAWDAVAVEKTSSNP